MNERIKALRKAKGLTQTEFGEIIGVKGNTITTYETGTRVPSDAVILSICREFNVSEAWLREGTEPMFLPRTRDEELLAYAAKVAAGNPNSIQAQLLAVMARLTDDQWEVLAQVAREFVEEAKKTDP